MRDLAVTQEIFFTVEWSSVFKGNLVCQCVEPLLTLKCCQVSGTANWN